MSKFAFFQVLGLLLCMEAFSQRNYQAGTLSQFNFNVKVAKNLKLNTKLESRQIFSEKELNTEASNKFQYERTDLAVLLTSKVAINNMIGGGYMIRLEDNSFSHRFIQQFNSVRNLDRLLMAHRIVTDETFADDEPTEFRLRYRLGLEMPLNGLHLDPKELYAKVNNEYLGIWADSMADLEIRGLFSIGYLDTKDNKVELGLEYRVNEFNKAAKAQQFWLTFGWFLSI